MNKIYSFKELTDSIELLEKKPPRFITWLLGFLLLFFLGVLIWIYLGKIEIVSKGTAIVQGESDIGIVRAQSIGIVDEMFVHKGDKVKKGEALMQVIEKRDEEGEMNHQNKKIILKAPQDGIVQLHRMFNNGDLIEYGQEVVSIIPKEDKKKIKILIHPQEIASIKEGDKVNYSFRLKNSTKQVGKITYKSSYPIFDKEIKDYVYELEATIDSKELQQVYIGMTGKASIVVGEESIWNFVLKKLDFISN
ncbi:HlyD family efflux transporter periplasmic adaptor subunit [Bacillus cereus]|uniref:HlyD family efflux transporter periplasmic adaptor subunit n=1 Tax=Bacillus cereus group TaxID=86661 RepID=UPI0019269759|nr:HlyD family efflux transporter periplasmic adaptor subunit [Bacillus cereus]MBL3887885.1 HlyD family efflux transporter periplasmic adaptor subunit [Bacillus cereus]